MMFGISTAPPFTMTFFNSLESVSFPAISARVAAEKGFSPFEFLSILVEVFRVKRNYSSPGYNIIPARI